MDLHDRIEQTITDIGKHYDRLINKLETRKHAMIDGLSTLKSWLEGVHQKRNKLEKAVIRARNNITIHANTRQDTVDQLETEINRLNALIESQNVEFKWDMQRQLEAENLGVLMYINRDDDILNILTLSTGQDNFDVQSFCNKGENQGELNYPEGVTVDPVYDRIIIANYGGNSIDIFSMNGDYISRFQDITLQGPNGVTNFNDEIYVTNLLSHCVTVFDFRTGGMIRKFGEPGKGDLEFSSPEGITVVGSSEGCSVYIADRENNRVKVLNGNLDFVKHIGTGQVKQPRDAKVYNEDVYILDGGMDACIKVFREDGLLKRQFLTQGLGKEVLKPRFFEIDYCGNLLISDKGNCNVLIYREKGKYVRLGGNKGDERKEFRMPTGITISMEGRIIVVDGLKNRNVIQLFNDPIINNLLN